MDEFVEHAPANNKTHKLLMTGGRTATTTQLLRWYGEDENRLGAHIPINSALMFDLDEYSNASDFHNAIIDWKDAKPLWAGEPNWMLSNHDSPRVDFRFGEGRHEALAMLTMMLPGINILYYVSYETIHNMTSF